LLLEALAAESKAQFLEAALHGRGAPGGAGRGPQQQPRRVLLDEAAGDLQGAVVEVDDALDLLPFGQLHGEDPAAVVEVGEGGGDGEQLARPGAGVPGQLQQVAELRVADEAEDLLIALLADELLAAARGGLLQRRQRRAAADRLELPRPRGPREGALDSGH